MPTKPQELTEAQKTERQINAMGDSVYVINKMIAEGKHTEQTHDNVDRNVRHLELMLGKSNIQDSGSDLTSFNTAITDGKAYIALPLD